MNEEISDLQKELITKAERLRLMLGAECVNIKIFVDRNRTGNGCEINIKLTK